MSTPRILHVVTNVAHYDDPAHATGLWLSELTHAWDVFAAQGYLQQLVSPRAWPCWRTLRHLPISMRTISMPSTSPEGMR